MIPACATAQSTEALVATLQHGDETKVFTGVTAFTDAYNAAADSADIITLSSGTFNSPVNFVKSVKVYGAGWESDSSEIAPTYIKDNIYLFNRDIVDDEGNKIKGGGKISGSHLEGLRFTNWTYFHNNSGSGDITDITFKKCYFSEIDFTVNSENLKFEQCYIGGSFGDNYNHKNLYLSNCYMGGYIYAKSTSSIFADHCILKSTRTNSAALYSNCIIYGQLAQGSTANNNIFVAQSSAGSGVLENKQNWYSIQESGIFADGSIDNRTFELKYPNKYIGTDGTQVGVHGGRYPWNKIPATPRIVESNIDTETSADGKLKVSIKVEAY